MVERLISLETEDRDLDELILQSYPGRLFEKNRRLSYVGGKRYFCYYGLDAEMFGLFAAKNHKVDGFKIHQFLGYPCYDKKGISLN